MCMVDDCDFVEVLREAEPTARKAHKCRECNRQIDQGEKHAMAIYRDHDGKPVTYRCCAGRKVAREWLSDQCGGYVYGGVLDDLQEHLDYDDRNEGLDRRRLARLIVGMRRKWTRRNGQRMRVAGEQQ